MRRTISFTVSMFLCLTWAALAQQPIPTCVDLPNGRSRLDGVWSPNTCEYNLSGLEQPVASRVDYYTGARPGAITQSQQYDDCVVAGTISRGASFAQAMQFLGSCRVEVKPVEMLDPNRKGGSSYFNPAFQAGYFLQALGFNNFLPYYQIDPAAAVPAAAKQVLEVVTPRNGGNLRLAGGNLASRYKLVSGVAVAYEPLEIKDFNGLLIHDAIESVYQRQAERTWVDSTFHWIGFGLQGVQNRTIKLKPTAAMSIMLINDDTKDVLWVGYGLGSFQQLLENSSGFWGYSHRTLAPPNYWLLAQPLVLNAIGYRPPQTQSQQVVAVLEQQVQSKKAELEAKKKMAKQQKELQDLQRKLQKLEADIAKAGTQKEPEQ